MNSMFELHRQEYKRDPQIVTSAPGIVRLLGAVADENKGVLLQGALNRKVCLSVSLRDDHHLSCLSYEENDRRSSSVKNMKNKREDRWLNLIKGVISEYELLGYEVPGMDMVLSSDVPQGIGLGSSSAICVAAALAILDLLKLDLSDIQMVQCAYLSESRFMENSSSVIADNITSFFAQEGHLVYFDVKKMDYRFLAVEDEKCRFYMVNSNVPVQIDEDEQERRDAYFENIREMMQEKGVSGLRDFDDFDLKQSMAQIPENARRFCSHIVNENSRVSEAVNALEAGKPAVVGKIMIRSQESLRDNYEVSCPEIDWLVKRAVELDGVFGARLTGPGFGGSLVAVVEPDVMESYQARLDEYERIFGFVADFYRIHFSAGSRVLFPEPVE